MKTSIKINFHYCRNGGQKESPTETDNSLVPPPPISIATIRLILREERGLLPAPVQQPQVPLSCSSAIPSAGTPNAGTCSAGTSYYARRSRRRLQPKHKRGLPLC